MVMVVSWDVNAQESSAESERFFESKVRPLLVERCHKCHAGTTAKGGLRVDTGDALLKGGESGGAIIVGKPDESLLLQAVRHQPPVRRRALIKLIPVKVRGLTPPGSPVLWQTAVDLNLLGGSPVRAIR